MRRVRLLLLLAAPLAGCDLFGILGGDSADYAFMDGLEGTWSLRYEVLRINTDGSTEVILDLSEAGTFVFAQEVECPETGFGLEGGDLFARAYTFVGDPAVVVPNMIAGCGIVFVDDPVRRINFIHGGFGGDVMMTIDENAPSRQVWSRYELFESEGHYRHTRYTLTDR